MADGEAAVLEGFPSTELHSFTVEQYHRMADAGILSPDDRVELIEGVVVSMAPIGAQHFSITLRMDRLLRAALGDRATVSVQGPVRMRPRSEPEPDIAVLKTRADDYETELPAPADVLLLVEVADTTLARDRDVKGLLYARHGIIEYWLVDVGAGEVIVHRDPNPTEGRYQSVQRVGADGMLDMAAVPNVRIPVVAVFRSPAA